MTTTAPPNSDAPRQPEEHLGLGAPEPEELARLAREVCRRGLAAPAVFFLELYKPLTTLLHTGVLMTAPLSAALFGSRNVQAAMQALESRDRVEQLIRMIEAGSRKGGGTGAHGWN